MEIPEVFPQFQITVFHPFQPHGEATFLTNYPQGVIDTVIASLKASRPSPITLLQPRPKVAWWDNGAYSVITKVITGTTHDPIHIALIIPKKQEYKPLQAVVVSYIVTPYDTTLYNECNGLSFERTDEVSKFKVTLPSGKVKFITQEPLQCSRPKKIARRFCSLYPPTHENKVYTLSRTPEWRLVVEPPCFQTVENSPCNLSRYALGGF